MEHTRFIGLDIHKERISVAVAGRAASLQNLVSRMVRWICLRGDRDWRPGARRDHEHRRGQSFSGKPISIPASPRWARQESPK
jgi:hypothetical protein